jgi:hypothetical protein
MLKFVEGGGKSMNGPAHHQFLDIYFATSVTLLISNLLLINWRTNSLVDQRKLPDEYFSFFGGLQQSTRSYAKLFSVKRSDVGDAWLYAFVVSARVFVILFGGAGIYLVIQQWNS